MRRCYNCYYYKKVDNIFIINHNSACWAGITSVNDWGIKEGKDIPDVIYIDISCSGCSKFHILNIDKVEKLCYILNKITECNLIQIQEKNNDYYIMYKYAFNKHYNKNLLLLNFVRLIWDNDTGLDKEQFFNKLLDYNEEDPFLFLTTCIKDNLLSPKPRYNSYFNHSCVGEVIPKTLKEFEEDNVPDTAYFLKREVKELVETL
tara:strand:+ start:12076 stop:12687 length:612 start_codon:yes stop_codon:yes gene_type:complete